jgi:hypothetical protein
MFLEDVLIRFVPLVVCFLCLPACLLPVPRGAWAPSASLQEDVEAAPHGGIQYTVTIEVPASTNEMGIEWNAVWIDIAAHGEAPIEALVLDPFGDEFPSGWSASPTDQEFEATVNNAFDDCPAVGACIVELVVLVDATAYDVPVDITVNTSVKLEVEGPPQPQDPLPPIITTNSAVW